MGFDPRTSARTPGGARHVTCNVDALLAENQALRQQVWFLRQQLLGLQGLGRESGVTTGTAPGITAAVVRRWGQALSRHPRWSELRVGASIGAAGSVTQTGLKGLLQELSGRGGDPGSFLERDLDRRSPGLGTELAAALRGPPSKVRLAVRAAFALRGVRAPTWLHHDPLGVVEELLERIERLDAASRRHRGGAAAEPQGSAADLARAEALRVLGLRWGASSQAVKAAHRRLVKEHHPDLGGDVVAFRRIMEAYERLTG